MIDWKRNNRQQHITRGLLVLLSLSALAASGCIVGPNYNPPETPAPDTWHQQLENGTYAGREEVAQWWHLLEDDKLNQLIDCADDTNLDLYAAFVRICQARAQRCIAHSARLADIAGTGSLTTTRQSENAIFFPISSEFLQRDNWALGMDFAWEPDVWGRITRQIQAADARLCGSVEDYRDVLVVLYAEVATNFVQVRTLQQRLEYAQTNVKIQEDALRLATRRVEAGVAPSLDMHQAESNLAGTQAVIPQLQTQLHQALNRLAVLLGQYPGTVHEFLAAKAPIPPPPANLPMSLPCDVIRQRPDIRRAEREIAARTADLGVAISDLLPRFTLNGTFGLQSLQASTLLQGDSWSHMLGPGFNWPIFQNGRIKCNIANAEALVEEAITIYQQTILLASEEVENSLIGYKNELKRQESLQVAVKASQKTLDDALDLYRAGKTNFQNVLDSLRTLSFDQDRLATSQGEIMFQLISIYRALGGGWNPNHHCGNRCIRLTCPERADPSVVEAGVSDDVTQRYFKQSGSDDDADDDDAKEGDTGAEDESDPFESDSLRLPSPDPDDTEEESFFERTLKELEDRLKESPAEGSDTNPS